MHQLCHIRPHAIPGHKLALVSVAAALTSRHAAGGLVSDDVFMRTVVSYGGSGRLASIQHEKFVRAA